MLYNFHLICVYISYYLTNHNVNVIYIFIATNVILLIIKTCVCSLFLNNNYLILNVNVHNIKTLI